MKSSKKQCKGKGEELIQKECLGAIYINGNPVTSQIMCYAAKFQ